MADRNPLPPLPPLRLDASSLIERLGGNSDAALDRGWRRSAAARDSLIAARGAAGSPLAEAAKVYDLPDKLLREYQQHRKRSELGQVLHAAPRLAAEVDRVVVLGDGAFLRGAQALLAACCHPRHNDLSRAERSGQPRIYYLNIAADNDEAAGLLDLFAHPPAGDPFEHRWALVVGGSPAATNVTTTIWRHWIDALWQSCGQDAAVLAERLVFSMAPEDARPAARRAGSRLPLFPLPDMMPNTADGSLPYSEIGSSAIGSGEIQSPFTATSLLIAALAGMDVVRLLRGAAAMNAHFREAPPIANAPLTLATIIDALGSDEGQTPLLGLMPATAGLDAIGRWVEAFLFSKRQHGGRGPLAITLPADIANAIPHRDPQSYDLLKVRLTVDGARRDRLAPVSMAEMPSEATLCDDLALRLSISDESSVGQLMQLFLLASELIACC